MNWDEDRVTFSDQRQGQDRTILDEPPLTEPQYIESLFRQFLREYRGNNNNNNNGNNINNRIDIDGSNNNNKNNNIGGIGGGVGVGGVGGSDENFIYRDQLNTNYDQKRYYIEVDFQHLNSFSPKMAEMLTQKPLQVLPFLEKAAQDVIIMSRSHLEDPTSTTTTTTTTTTNTSSSSSSSFFPKIQVQVINVERTATSIRELDSTHISQLLKIPGIAISASKPSCKASKITIMCSNCRTSTVCSSARSFGQIILPRRCVNSNNERNERPCPLDPYVVLADKCEYLDVQSLKLQESPEDIPTGEMPRHIWLFCERQLVNKIKPGSRVNIIGVYKIMETSGGPNKDMSVRKPYVEVIGIEERIAGGDNRLQLFTLEEEEDIRELAKHGSISDLIAQSIAPAIWGNTDVKKALACLLFGGSRKILPDGMKLRGDINVLLLGDPSVAKSQLLKFVKEVSPIGVYTSGKGSSASGLTASVIKEGGEFHLEGGAMVLADGGVVCIDEFDKMREQDRVAIHEAMEQQTISIAKAGITTILNSRTAVLAAANPVFGRYDDLRTTAENIEFETTILSRFDLIFIIRDIKDKDRDMQLAQHIIELHIETNPNSEFMIGRPESHHSNGNNTAPIHPAMLAKYIAYAKRIHPRLNNAAVDMLRTHYVQFRQESKQREIETGEPSAIPLTIRQLESLIRIAESLAKMELSTEANEEHVKEAVRLFKVATLRAAKHGLFEDVSLQNGAFQENVQKAERNIRRRVAIASTISVKKLVDEMAQKSLPQRVVLRALDNLVARQEFEYRARKLKVFRK